jgi:hypothetical protein
MSNRRKPEALVRGRLVLAAAALGLLVAAPAAAQMTTGTISGNVVDTGGLAVPGASVTITNTETGATRSVTTDNEGAYLMTALPPGLYRVNVTMSGFRSFLQEEFRLAVGQNARVDARLEVGGVAEQVSVIASSLRVDTRSSAVVTVVDPQRMQELPMLNRSVLTLAVLAPGITDVSVPDAVTDQRSAPTINSAATGSRTNQNDLQLDGATLTTSLYNRASNLPSPDSIQEFQVLTNSYSAEYGRGGGTSLLAITKSGSNRFRWAAWEYYRDDALNGVNYFAVTKPYMLRNQFGANIGGPIRREKTFFFFNYERLLFDQQQILTFTPPTAAQRAGDFSASTTLIYDPQTGAPFPGNRIPSNRFDPLALELLQYVPLPNQPDGITYTENTPRDTEGDQFSVKVDHRLGSSNTLSVRWYRDLTSAVRTNGEIQDFWTRQGNTLDTWTFTDTHIFSNRMVGEGRLSFTKIETEAPSSPAASRSPRDLGFQFDQGDAGELPRIPQVSVSGVGGAFTITSNGEPWLERSRLSGGNYRVSWITGNHSLKFGYEYLFRSQFLYSQGNSSGTLAHNGASTRSAAGDGGIGMADYLLGRPTNFSQGTPFDNREYVSTHNAFVQDDLRLKRLTLNLGLRFDAEVPWKEDGDKAGTYVQGQESTRYPDAPPGLVYPGDAGIPSGFVPTSYRVSPRTGFAWDVRGDGRTALRGGYGLFSSSEPAISIAIAQEVPPYFPSISFPDPYSFVDPWGPNRTSIFPYVRNDQGEGIFPDQPFSLEVIGLDWRPGYMHQFNFSYQRQLGNDLVVSAGYVGSRGRNLTTLREHNLAAFIPDASTPQNVEDRRPDQNFTNVILTTSGSWSDYDSLQVTAMKRYTNNYTVQLIYTLGRTFDDGGVGEAGSSVQDPANPRADNARANNDRRHVLRINGMYEIPRFESFPPVVRDVLGGWRLAGILSYLSGTPFNVTSGVDRALQGCGGCAAQRPDLNGDPELPGDRSLEEKIAKYFNTDTVTLWTLPALGLYGNAPRNVLRGPGYFNTDLSLSKLFRLTPDGGRVEFRIEAFNLFDTVNLGSPNGNRNSVNFGRITSAGSPRVLQLALRLDF